MLDIFGDREISIAREIAKKYESIYRGNISGVINNFDNIKGEFVIVVSGYSNDNDSELNVVDSVNLYISNGMDKMSAIKMVAKDKNISKSEVYSMYHKEDLK